MSNLEFTTFINTLANVISNKLTNKQIGLLAVTFTQLGDTLATIAVLKDSTNGDDFI